jgi:hypothetical protein
MHFAIIFYFIASLSRPILNKVFDHGHRHHEDDREEHGRLAIGDTDGLNRLQNANDHKEDVCRFLQLEEQIQRQK